MNYIEVKSNNNDIIDNFIADNNLFALFDAPVNLLFVDNFLININRFKDVFSKYNMGNNIFFSCKVNKAFTFLKYAAYCNCGIEVSSIYELKDALKFTNKIIATGPAKTEEYLKLAISNNCIISVDDIEELKLIKKINLKSRISLRISNLQGEISRFGINKEDIKICLKMIKNSNIELEGFSFHFNNYNLDFRIYAIKELLNLIKRFKLFNVKFIDIGGGIPVKYCSKNDWENFNKNLNPGMFFRGKIFEEFYPFYSEITSERFLLEILKNLHISLGNIQIYIEPGRSLLNNCGISIYRVEYTKKLYNGDNIVVTNGNINCLSEQWFNTDYLIEPKLISNKLRHSEKIYYASVAGNLCLEQDMLTWRKIKFPYKPNKGDYLIYYNTASYQMDSNESMFHKIPLVKKYFILKEKNGYIIGDDEKNDSKVHD